MFVEGLWELFGYFAHKITSLNNITRRNRLPKYYYLFHLWFLINQNHYNIRKPEYDLSVNTSFVCRDQISSSNKQTTGMKTAYGCTCPSNAEWKTRVFKDIRMVNNNDCVQSHIIRNLRFAHSLLNYIIWWDTLRRLLANGRRVNIKKKKKDWKR